MKQFAELFTELDGSTSTLHKVQALRRYFDHAPAEDSAWAVYFLSGGKPKRTVPTRTLREVALQVSGLPDWLFEESYQAVGDLAETIAHVLPMAPQKSDPSHGLAWWMRHRILPLRNMPDEERIAAVQACWNELAVNERFLFVKLVGGGFRVGVSKLLVTRALAELAGLDAKLVATRMMGFADGSNLPTAEQFMALLAPPGDNSAGQDSSRLGQPLPFFLAHPLQEEPENLGAVAKWLVEWKYDGIRAQVVKEAGQVWVWSRGEELVSEQFPELQTAFAHWPEGCILDGEILVWHGDAPAGFNALQGRLNRTVVSKKLMLESPVVFLAYDLLRLSDKNTVDQAQWQRRTALEEFHAEYHTQSTVNSMSRFLLSQRVQASSWVELKLLREESRARGVEGFMLKHTDSRYGVGRTKADGLWWKWKIDPMTVDCVLVYAQRGHGRRASLYTDYTFAVWETPPANAAQAQEVAQAIANGEKVDDTVARGLPRLVPFAKAYSGLTDDEFKEVDRVIRKHTVDKFGPVRTVVPVLVFELGFEAISRSTRHKSGVAVRFPRMLRIRHDKPLHEADHLAVLEALLPPENAV
ncbi:MAG: cisplatin damage response ATP-dependent DNA ligase [Gammaproteobacteria bacterium]|uniref:cisplatin damage response ATP-dependent DNA ligase n=1 Tax=Limnobacter sp. TaxID=2003368 RepID=UPI001D8A8C18|nr:cisplatin damage response ATP-dependent DNA ligase [Limnobacter sp.]MBU0784740.1 cisplatin damage response ATP-dependent DNA ligase [Gammaproteobacteria bacterium]MBU0848125.1 cisplatin damage response ATP-dependent DNA ligase [Gammaproteobacteria bacterium]MBU1267166.1 cisplatin damage response ATP-dependent DNA ligase [Gammaproteobacteria bacterium]MBU1528798.1 cisplatin damage response ATP-dependent DNA ligase [Gammaproteobacteria bacterium]MBU1779838.1 cisplatin damage response ATP-depe